MPAPEIPPAGVRLIRQRRGETRGELADHLGVSIESVGNWERGDNEPLPAHRFALLAAKPDELSLSELQTAGERLDDDLPGADDDEQWLFGSKWLQTLRQRPRTAAELGSGKGMAVFDSSQGKFVEVLDLPNAESDGDPVTTVFYLQGDERRAIRRFIVENEAIVRDQLTEAPNRFSHEWGELHYRLLWQEWRFWQYE